MSFYMHTCIWIQIIYFTVLYEIKTKQQQHRTLHSHIYHSHLHPIGMWAWCWATCSVPSLRSYEYIHEHLLSPVLTINIPHRWEIKGLQVVWGKKIKWPHSYCHWIFPNWLRTPRQESSRQLKLFSFRRVQNQDVPSLTDLSSAEAMFHIPSSFFSTFITDTLPDKRRAAKIHLDETCH